MRIFSEMLGNGYFQTLRISDSFDDVNGKHYEYVKYYTYTYA